MYTCAIPSNSTGTYSAAISYSGDQNYNAAGPSAAFNLNIARAAPTVTVSTSDPNAALGATFIFTATVTGPAGGQLPTGTPTWNVTGVSGITCAYTTGPTVDTPTSVKYTCSVNATIAGTYIPLFTYNGDGNYLAAPTTSGASTTVGMATPTAIVSANSVTATLGSTITFTATVSGPTGAVAPSSAGSWAITGVGAVTSCAAVTGPSQSFNISTYTCSTVATVAGTYGANFIFIGDSSYNPVTSTASATTTVVAPALPTVVLANLPATPTLGGTQTITATITGATNGLAPSGNMSWNISGTAGVAACTRSFGATSFGNSTIYSCILETPNVGTYVVSASYAGDNNYLTVSSSPLILTIVKQTPGITVIASANPTLGGTTTLTTTVTGYSFASAPTGAVSWLITDPSSVQVTCLNPSAGVVVVNVVTYTCHFVTVVPGAYHINSTVAEDSNYLPATSSTITVNLGTVIPSIVVNSFPSAPTSGQLLSFTANVTGITGLPAPTGTLVWTVGGQAHSCTSSPNPVSGGITTIYTCNIAAPVAGDYTVNAAYNGNAYFAAAAVVSPVTLRVGQAIPTIALTVSPVTPSLGNAITFTATVVGATGAVRPAGTIVWG